MKLNAVIKDRQIVTTFNLDDGVYDIDINPKGDNKTWEQTKKLWATVDDISRAEYGNVSQSNNIYLQILQMAGVRTDVVTFPSVALKDIKKKFKAINILAKEVVNHQEVTVARVCVNGISEMTKKEVSQVIETAIMWASELGIQTELERE